MPTYKFSLIRYTCLVMVFMYLISCTKYLDKKPDSKLIVPSNLNDLQALLDNSYRMNRELTPSYGEQSADDYFLFDEDAAPEGEYSQIYTWQPDYNQQDINDWSVAYKATYIANYCLEQLENIQVTGTAQEKWNNVKGSALFYRAYNFLMLLWNHAAAYNNSTAGTDYGIVLKTVADYNSPSIRASVEESYKKVIEDTKAAIAFLPNYPLHVMRPSKGAAYGLLARAYLSMGMYNESLLYADSCLQLNNRLMNFNGDDELPSDISINYPFKPYNKEVIFYTEMRNNTLTRTDIISRIDTILVNSFQERDLRKKAYFSKTGWSGVNVDGYTTFKGAYTIYGYFNFTGIATDEMYLIRAESYVRTGQVQKGLDDLNTLMYSRWESGAWTPLQGIDQQQALEIILKERRKELIFRGLRWIEIKRLNRDGANIAINRLISGQTYTLEPNAPMYALPIPNDIVRITGIPQNPVR